MRLSSLWGLYLLGQTTAAPIAAASHPGDLTHAHWANLDHRRLLSASHANLIPVATDVDSRGTTPLLGIHLSNRVCSSPDCDPSPMAPPNTTASPTDAVTIVASIYSCTVFVLGGCILLAILVGNSLDRRSAARSMEKHHQADVTTTKVEPQGVAADEEVSDDFDDTDYPMG